MKANLKTFLLPLLLLAAVAGALVWLLPVRVTLILVIIIQALMLVVLGDILKGQKDNNHETEA
ncbi:MAG: hypothetical protein J5732_02945 [Bacteroidaceae bacterium]|nr:hypothetical protein [Bacteroidaceae bacterium]